MIPISDDNSDRHLTPVVNYIFIALNILVFVFLQGMGTNLHFTYSFAAVPAEILSGSDITTHGQIVVDQYTGEQFEIPGLQVTPIPVYFTLITSMFMHGGWAHLIGNMLYLWVFGDNIENRIGHTKYFIFYMLCGIFASLSHVLSSLLMPNTSLIPSLGASGAISGILGAYIILFPNRRVNMLLGWWIVAVPAVLALGIWIIFQVVSGIGMLGGSDDGVAYAAHIGGFITGIIFIKIFDRGNNKPYGETRKFIYRR